jgi:dienelactone hydrolase
MRHQNEVNRHSLNCARQRAIANVTVKPGLLLMIALSGVACSTYIDWPTGAPDGSDSDSPRDGAGRDAALDASVEDVRRLDDGSWDRSMDDAAKSGGGETSVADGPKEDQLGEPTETGMDGSAIDVPIDLTRADASSSDAPGDPTAPRFSRTARYTIVIPPLGDAGTGTTDASARDGGGDGGAGDPADIYYPDPPDLRTFGYSFPVVLLLQGAKVARGFYGGVATGVAAYGFIVVVPDHMSNNIGGPGLYAELGEIAAAGAQMKIEAMSEAAPVRGVVDTTRMALMGHSYGGASGLSGMASLCFPPIPLCTFQRPPELAAGAFYGTNLAAPVLGVPALDTGALPVLLVQGDRDGKALPADALKTYDQIQTRPKAILTLLGANHYGVTDADNPAGADPEVNAQTLDHAVGVASTARWIGVFLAAFLQGDGAARAALRSAGAHDRHVAITLAE